MDAMSDSDRPPNDDATSDEEPSAKRDRSSILARRKFFIASALAGITAASCNTKEPQVCLKTPAPTEGTEEAPAETDPPDVSPTAEPTSAPSGSAPVASADPPPPPPPEPQVCLKVPAPSPTNDKPKPQVCLRVAAPPKDDPK